MFKTPAFWYRPETEPPPPIERALEPLSHLYRAGYTLHQGSRTARNADIPVICIGNVVAGGTGKTPTALAIMELMRTNNLARNPFFLLRGYGGGEVGPIVVDPKKHNAWDTGDEALVLARSAPTVVSVDRLAGADLALRKGGDLVLMDDGLQNPGIRKDIQIVVINGEMGFGNCKIMPAGPLREPLDKGISRADAFIIIGEDRRGVSAKIPANKPLFGANLRARADSIPPKDRRYIAFAGLGYPDKFFNFLREDIGLDLCETVKFPDHYPYSEHDVQDLVTRARTAGAELLTTEKDFMRLPAQTDDIPLHILRIDLAWSDRDGIVQFLRDKLDSSRS